MALTNCYCTLAELQARAGIDDTVDDVTLEQVITGVSRLIDQYTRRHFYSASETRYYSPAQTGYCEIDDLLSVTTLATDDNMDRTYATTWAATDYDLLPTNAALETRPYTMVVTAPNGRYSFPRIARGLKIVGVFGYATATPPVVREACLLQAQRIFKRKDAPFGIMGAPDLGMLRISRLDPDVAMLLQGVTRYAYGVRP